MPERWGPLYRGKWGPVCAESTTVRSKLVSGAKRRCGPKGCGRVASHTPPVGFAGLCRRLLHQKHARAALNEALCPCAPALLAEMVTGRHGGGRRPSQQDRCWERSTASPAGTAPAGRDSRATAPRGRPPGAAPAPPVGRRGRSRPAPARPRRVSAPSPGFAAPGRPLPGRGAAGRASRSLRREHAPTMNRPCLLER